MLNIRGLVEGKSTKDFVQKVWDRMTDRTVSKKTLDMIESVTVAEDFKRINESLEPLLGAYTLDVYALPEWWGKFKELFTEFIGENIKDEILEDFLDKAEKDECVKLNNALKELKAISPQEFKEGKLPNGQKILKYLKKITELTTNVKGDDVEKTEWWKLYNNMKTGKQDEVVVITSSISSFIGMSSMFENPTHSSCMTLFKNDQHRGSARAIFTNLYDPNSLLLYVTREGLQTQMYNLNEKDFTHQGMICRVMLRLFQRGGKKYLVLDRFYPHGQYLQPIAKLLEGLCKQHGLILAVPSSYNAQQSTFVSVDKILKIGSSIGGAESVEPIMLGWTKEHDRVCTSCDFMRKSKSCDTCQPFSKKDICPTCPVANQSKMYCRECGERGGSKCSGDCTECTWGLCKNPNRSGIFNYNDQSMNISLCSDRKSYNMTMDIKPVIEVI